jgi:ElaB/YqjD/DUF883 family membrane-anchored ribosome-binding protein
VPGSREASRRASGELDIRIHPAKNELMEKKAAQSTATPLEEATAEALRAIDEVRELLAAATSDDLDERATSVREKLEASREALERAAREKIEPLRSAKRSIQEDLDEAEAWIRENPLRAALTAGGVGLLLGLLLSRRR